LINTGHGAFPIPEEYSANQKLQHEIETLGFPLSRHPLDLYRSQLERIQYISASDMAQHIGRTVTMIGWLVTEKMAQTKDGDPMEFITLEDTTALYDATLFPAVYRRVCQLLATEHAYVLRGRIEEQFGVATLTIENLRTLNAFSLPPPKRAQRSDGRHGKC
jgi:error-prone DNA polymerase